MLAGGRSSRMGTPKASLEWHGSTLVRRVAGIVARTLDGPVVIVRAPGQRLPPLPADHEVVEDGRAGRGPLEALAAGLGALVGRTEVAFVSATDAPLLHPALISAVLAGLDEGHDICTPVLDGVCQPLAAAYRTGVLPAVATLLAEDELRLGRLLERCRVRRLSREELLGDRELAAADPRLDSLLNLNGPGAYQAARKRPPPAISVLFRSGLAGAQGGDAAASERRAATLGAAAAGAGLRIADGMVVATVNGRPVGGDPQLPLVEGDEVVFAPGLEPSRA